MVCRCLYILLGTGQFCNSSTICWIAKDFALAVLSCCNLVGRPDFALCCTILFGSGSADRPMLTQFNHIVSGLQMLLNHDPINENCVSFVALHQNRRIVWAFLGPEPEGRPLFSFFCKGRQSPSCLPCWAMQCWRCNFNDRGKEAESERNRSQSISIVFGFEIICN